MLCIELRSLLLYGWSRLNEHESFLSQSVRFAATKMTQIAIPLGTLGVRTAVYLLATFLSLFMNNSATVAPCSNSNVPCAGSRVFLQKQVEWKPAGVHSDGEVAERLGLN